MTVIFNAGYANNYTETFDTPAVSGNWTVPASVDTITIYARGAAGGIGDASNKLGGGGAETEGSISVVPGDVIYYVVGEQGNSGGLGDGAGGGSTGVFLNGTLVMVAGGGAGYDNTGGNDRGGLATENGGLGSVGGYQGNVCPAQTVATGGAGGAGGLQECPGNTSPGGGGGGGGINGAGQASTNGAGGGGAADMNPLDGLSIAAGGVAGAGNGLVGGSGFTGGGGSDDYEAGGGGGYSGGSGANGSGSAGGGGSFVAAVVNSETITAGQAATNTGDGEVIITYQRSPTAVLPPLVPGYCGAMLAEGYTLDGMGIGSERFYQLASGSVTHDPDVFFGVTGTEHAFTKNADGSVDYYFDGEASVATFDGAFGPFSQSLSTVQGNAADQTEAAEFWRATGRAYGEAGQSYTFAATNGASHEFFYYWVEDSSGTVIATSLGQPNTADGWMFGAGPNNTSSGPNPITASLTTNISYTVPASNTDGIIYINMLMLDPQANWGPINFETPDCPPILTLEKTVVNDDSGTAADTDWTLEASDGTTSISGKEGDASITTALLDAGTYTLTESGGPNGYTQTALSCVDEGGNSVVLTGAGANEITLADTDNVTCTFTNDDVAPAVSNGVINYPDSGTGIHNGSLALLDWSSSSLNTGVLNDGDVVDFPLPSCYAGTLRATFSNVANANSLNLRDMDTWAGASAFKGYNGAGNGEAIHTIDDDLAFTVDWSLIINGVPRAPDIFILDAESTNSTVPETIDITTNGGDWTLIENINGAVYGVSGLGTQAVQITKTQSPSHSPVLLSMATSQTSVAMNAGGNQAVAFGVLLPCDYSDAPASYGTPSHAYQEIPNPSGLGLQVKGSEPLLGTVIDSEQSAQASPNADGDDTDTLGADEDGVTLFSPITTATNAYGVNVVASNQSGAAANVMAWIDFDGNGTFDPDEASTATPVANGTVGGTVTLLWPTVPAGTVAGDTFARVRLSSDVLDANQPGGALSNGEVEDYKVTVVEVVARPPLVPGSCQAMAEAFVLDGMGIGTERSYQWNSGNSDNDPALFFAEYFQRNPTTGVVNVFFPGAPDATASGTPASISYSNLTSVPGGAADQTDAAEFWRVTARLDGIPGQTYTFNTTNGGLFEWSTYWATDASGNTLDYHNDSDGWWAGWTTNSGGEGNSQTMTYTIPPTSTDGIVYLNIIVFDPQAAWGPIQFDYDCEQDYGDAPASYGDASHVTDAGMQLGTLISKEAGSFDDPNAAADDDDAVTLPDFYQGALATIPVDVTQVAANDGYLQAWIDFNGDGDFDDVGEQVATDLQLATGTTGTINVPLAVPETATTSQTFARFRWSKTAGLGATGSIIYGEVEDYALTIKVPLALDLPIEECTSVWYKWEQPFIDVNGNNNGTGTVPPEGFNPTYFGFAKQPSTAGASTWYAPTVAPFDTEVFDNLTDEPAETTSEITSEIQYGVLYATYSPGAPVSVALSDSGAWEGHAIAAFDSAGNQIGRWPTVSDVAGGQFFYFSGNAGHVSHPVLSPESIPQGVSWSTTLAFTAPADGIVYYHMVVADEKARRSIMKLPAGSSCLLDYSDSPATYGDATHIMDTTDSIRLGASNDGDPVSVASPNATDDGVEDDAISTFPALKADDRTYRVTVNATNTTAQPGRLLAWIDFDGNGTFDADETAARTVPAGTTAGNFVLAWSSIPPDVQSGSTFMRLRLTTDALNATEASGEKFDGEVEDYALTILDSLSVSGRVYIDTNSSASNDPGEAGIGGTVVVLHDQLAGTCRSAVTNSDGDYRFSNVPDSGFELYQVHGESTPIPQVCSSTAQRNPTGYQSTTADVLSFFVLGADVTNQDFGEVAGTHSSNGNSGAGIAFDPDHQGQILPGNTTFYAHQFTSEADGAVRFSSTGTGSATSGWTHTLYRDDDCNGELNGAEGNTSIESLNLGIAAGGQICIVDKVFAPANVPAQDRYEVTTTATFSFAGSTLAGGANAIETLSVTDVTTAGQVGTPATSTTPEVEASRLELTKKVENLSQSTPLQETLNQASPGDVLRYHIYYRNVGTGPITDLEVNDTVPVYTGMVSGSATCVDTPTSLTNCTPAVNVDEISWDFTGALLGGDGGRVTYDVMVDN